MRRSEAGRRAAKDPAGGTSSRVVRRMVDFAEKRGHAGRAICTSAGVRYEALQEADARIPHELVERLGQRVLAAVGDANFGLHLASDVEDARHMDAGVLLLMASPTVEAALERMVRLQRYWADGPRARLVRSASGLTVRWSTRYESAVARHADECALAEMVLGLRAMTAHPIRPQAVRFRHGAPADAREHAALFACPVHFRAEYTELVLDAATVAVPMAAANATFAAIFEAQVEAALERLGSRDAAVTAQARSAMTAALSGRFTVADTARLLGLTARTLQRRLRDEGTSFAAVREALRHEMALAYLDRGMPVCEVAWSLGFGDAAAFHHAFKRWTGTTPERLRKPPMG